MNFIDVYQREGKYPLELPFTAGNEGAGVVRAVGDGVTDVAVGDRVAWAMVNGTGYTSVAVVPADRVVPVPDGVTDEQALSVVLQGSTAWHLLRTSSHMAEGETVVVIAGAGGVGSLAVQLARHWGAGRVIATASSRNGPRASSPRPPRPLTAAAGSARPRRG